MEVSTTSLPGVLLLTPKRFRDERGFFQQLYHSSDYAAAGIDQPFAQDNLSFSGSGVLRGLHFQHPMPQGKLVTVLAGAIFDVAVDIRRGSPTFGRWFGVELSADNGHQLWIPGGFAHGFCVMGESALCHYKCTGLYAPEYEAAIRWNDPQLAIDWPVTNPVVSEKDASASTLAELDPDRLPVYISECS
ncbi:MAG: dTDP-4-dehydrorhamnose 3,5-epimerase [Gammaproteobacteria bacterium]